ncbi:amino acid-binding protein [Nocardiopsis sp. MG754419]|uniref:amino acid-binding protein n=1 Tax=Nocardiopsis sp. MG754419 TaxID=2259865 RepID=UPI001BA76BC7|nr:amino acid-binding protein [Nocardiopsis sp. MG754419]MBR8742226.1 amino acid-binding protein [Nocardiopsis sp. MG754419]
MDASMGSHGTDDRPGFLGREVLELGTLLFAAGAAHLLVVSLGHSDDGVRGLIVLGTMLLVLSLLHRWHRHRRGHRRPRNAPTRTVTTDHRPAVDDRLWGVRVTVADVPGGLAALTVGFAALGVDIRLMQVHPGGGDAVDEFFVSAPAGVDEADLYRAVREAGGRSAVVRPADVHELSDTTSRTLTLVEALVSGTTTVERCLSALTAARDVRHTPASDDRNDHPEMTGTMMVLPAPDGGTFSVHRADLPFTPVEFARCRALAQVARSLHERTGHPFV